MKTRHCPACAGSLHKTDLAEHLKGQRCSGCNGVSITLGNYLHYLTKSPTVDEGLQIDASEISMDEDTKSALVCSCGQIMTKYRITHDSDRKLDYCTSCQSIWMDAGEWEYLKSNNMHRSINKIFTDGWQRNIRFENTKQVLQQNYRQQLGEQDYQRIRDVKEWIEKHTEKNVLMSYLNASDPYSAEK